MGRIRFPSETDCEFPPPHQLLFDSNMPADTHWSYALTGRAVSEETGQVILVPNHAKVYLQPAAAFETPEGPVLNPNAENLKHLGKDYYISQFNAGKLYLDTNLYQKPRYFVTGKAIFPNYKQHIHFNPKLLPDPEVPPILGLDFGVRNPAVVFLQAYPNGRIIASSEIVLQDKSGLELADIIFEHLHRYYKNQYHDGIGDPSGKRRSDTDKKSMFDVLRARGLRFRPAPTQDLEVRLETVDKVLTKLIDGVPQLVVGKKCPMLHKALSGDYRYRKLKTADGRYDTKPDKNHASHIADALQYGLSEVRGASPVRRPEHLRKSGRQRVQWGGTGNLV